MRALILSILGHAQYMHTYNLKTWGHMAIDTTPDFKKVTNFFFSMGADVYITCHILVKRAIVGTKVLSKAAYRLPL